MAYDLGAHMTNTAEMLSPPLVPDVERDCRIKARKFAVNIDCRVCGTGPCRVEPAPTRKRRGDWMQLASGRAFYPLDPRPEEIHIEDIAAALSKLCRYGGHCKRFYSVAEHSVLMARAAPDGLHLAALLHDASEAYLSDVIRPIKAHLTNYRTIETELERAIAKRFCIAHPMPAGVKALDERIIADERDQAMLPAPQAWSQWTPVPPLGVTLQFWTPEKAEFEFLAAFRRYGGHWC
jgi:hypothetical protein